jgi:hypothetical protein
MRYDGSTILVTGCIRTHCGITDFGDNGVAHFRLTLWLYALSGAVTIGPAR